MRSKFALQIVSLLVVLATLLAACGQATPTPAADWSQIKSAAEGGGQGRRRTERYRPAR